MEEAKGRAWPLCVASGGRIQGCPEGEAAQQCSPALTTAVKGSQGPD